MSPPSDLPKPHPKGAKGPCRKAKDVSALFVSKGFSLAQSSQNSRQRFFHDVYCGGQNNGPNDVCILIPQTRDFVTLRGKRDFKDVVQLRILGQSP